MVVIPSAIQIKMARHAANLSRAEASDGIGLSISNLANIEDGTSKPRLSTLERLIRFYEAKGVEFGPDGWVRLKVAA